MPSICLLLRIQTSLEDLLWVEEVNARALEPEQNGMSWEEGMGEEGQFLSLYKGGRNYAPPHLPGKLAYSPGAVIDGAVGLPTPVLMRIPL